MHRFKITSNPNNLYVTSTYIFLGSPWGSFPCRGQVLIQVHEEFYDIDFDNWCLMYKEVINLPNTEEHSTRIKKLTWSHDFVWSCGCLGQAKPLHLCNPPHATMCRPAGHPPATSSRPPRAPVRHEPRGCQPVGGVGIGDCPTRAQSCRQRVRPLRFQTPSSIQCWPPRRPKHYQTPRHPHTSTNSKHWRT